ncbi:MAG: hypothetical protein NZM09_09275, partial [Ignavibacterium sp.]|nr:hypothetical protein [Ignavibacterium sp.]MDW8375872.1 hypothetical protein [Ignavibacteriales bacterium]
MNFIIVSGPNLTDYQSIELIKKELQLKQIKYKTITDKEFLSENLTDKFIISVGGPAVNELSIIIKSIYKKKIDLSCYGSTSYNNFYGSQNGVIMNNYNIGGCIAFWGEEALDTLNCA